jgi:hypothetical protein
MSYRKSWSKTFKTDDFILGDCLILGCAELCPEHEPYCFRAVAFLQSEKGSHRIHLVDPISISSKMPGTKQKLLKLSVKSMLTSFSGWYSANASIKVIADNAVIFERSVNYDQNNWKVNEWELDRDISNVHTLDVVLSMDAHGFVGWCTLHCTEISLCAEYYASTPPATADVKVTVKNKQTGASVGKAYVALMSGDVIAVDGYTDGGQIIFPDVDEGSYTIKILAGGYYEFSQSIDVIPPSVWYEVKLVPTPVSPYMEWLKYGAIAAAAIGSVYVAGTVIKKREETKFMVMR